MRVGLEPADDADHGRCGVPATGVGAHRKCGENGRADHGRLDHFGHQQRPIQHIGLDLVPEPATRLAAHAAHLDDLGAVQLEPIAQRAKAERHTLEQRAQQMAAVVCEGETCPRAARARVRLWRALASKMR